MLDDLTPAEFEDWCRVLLERYYHCEVEATPYVADEGRDLIVHHPSGKILVECKHQSTSAVGRPVVQKLHSAILKAHVRKGMIITTGRISTLARQYAAGLEDVEIELVDGAKLSYMAETVGLSSTSSYLDDRTSLAVSTIPEKDFPRIFLNSIFAEPRFNPGHGRILDDWSITRQTTYEGRFECDFSAQGELETAAGTFSASWEGTVWTTLDGRTCGLADFNLPLERLIPLGHALERSPGVSSPPAIQPHEAARKMKDYLLRTCTKTIEYTGRNNITYRREVKPNAHSIQLSRVHLVYFPKQTFELRTGQVVHTGSVEEQGDQFVVESRMLSTCYICTCVTTARDQIFCAVCHRAAHRWRFLTPDSFRCSRCNATICRNHTRRNGGEKLCTRCSGGHGKPLGKRWWPHLALGVITSLLLGFASTSVAPLHLPPKASEVVMFLTPLGVLAGWVPFLYVASKWSFGNKRYLLSYQITETTPGTVKLSLPAEGEDEDEDEDEH